ncbi:MAG: aromatic ring-hydroxylating dioxygenase subunit alpha [Candidatus Rokuibacteriota bacterium]|nr:MAG: aromatic ring-hydroxylating dioxygenase subunit alpha [Candidatus Rokubacteria bacterium]
MKPDIFDPSHYGSTRLADSEAETLPAWAYTSPEFYEREAERIFMRVWNFIGRAEHIPNPGDYFTLEFAGVPVIVVRDDAGRLRAFVNSCRHRGTILVEGEGSCRAFKCPYHSWAYALDGELLSAPEMQKTSNFDCAQYPLVAIRLETWAGFVFINFDAKAEPLLAYLGDFTENLAGHAADLVCVRRKVYELKCNWKLFAENAKEAYHIATVHRRTINQYASAEVARYEYVEVRGQYAMNYAEHPGSMALLKGDSGFPTIRTLEGRARHGTLSPFIFPSTYIAATIDTLWYLELHPHGPDRTTLVHGACFPRAVVERPDFEVVVKNYYKRWDITIEEDNAICEMQQRGLASRINGRGRFCHRERVVHQIDNWVLDRVLGPGAKARQGGAEC